MATLFLDRDGVINIQKEGSYIFTIDEFEFYPGVVTALAQLTHSFDRIIVVTNQRGIGRRLMTVEDLEKIHQYLNKRIEAGGGKIDAYYFAPDIEDNHPMRKPNPGMALAAKADFPAINFSDSVMVGNSISDLKFGKNLGMKTVFIHSTQPPLEMPNSLADLQAASLIDWVKSGNLLI